MSMLNRVRRNVPKARIQDIFLVISGKPKVGKTTLFAEIADRTVGIDKALLIATEPGYVALDMNVIDIDNYRDFEKLVDELVKAKANGECPFEYLCLDTIDKLWDQVEAQVIREYNVENPQKRVKTLNQIPYGQGSNRAKRRLDEDIDKLRKAGFGIVAITHSKQTSIEKDGQKFDMIQLSVPGKTKEVFIDAADIVVFIDVQREINENGDVVAQRYMIMRNDGFYEGGSRYPDLPEKIPYDVDLFIKTVEEGIRRSIKNGMSLQQLREQQAKEIEEKSMKYAQEISKSAKQLIAEIDVLVNKMDQQQQIQFAKTLQNEIGTAKYKNLTEEDVELLRQALELAKEVGAKKAQ